MERLVMKSIGEFVRDENFKKRKLSGDVSCLLYSQDGKEKKGTDLFNRPL